MGCRKLTYRADFTPLKVVHSVFQMKEKSCAEGYRYGFNGKEFDKEWNSGGAMYDYGFRIYDPRLGKFLSVDPLSKKYPFFTPYQFAGNNPIVSIDVDGLEGDVLLNEVEKEFGWIKDRINSWIESGNRFFLVFFQTKVTELLIKLNQNWSK